MSDRDNITLPREVARLALSYIEWYIENEDGGRFVQVREAAEALRTTLAAEPTKKTPAWWMDGLAATLMREGVNKHRAREIAVGYWEAYCQIPGNEKEPT